MVPSRTRSIARRPAHIATVALALSLAVALWGSIGPAVAADGSPSPVPHRSEHSIAHLRVTDPAGDVAVESGAVVPAPGYMDITSFDVAAEADDLVVTIEVAGDLDEVLTATPSPIFNLWVTGPASSGWEWFWVLPAEDWAVEEQFGFWERRPLGAAAVDDDQVTFRVPRPRFIAPEKLRFAFFMVASFVNDISLDDESPTPSAEDREVLPWEPLADSVPDFGTGPAFFVDIDGQRVRASIDDPMFRSPLVRSTTAELVLGQPREDIGAPRIDTLRDATNALFASYGDELAALPPPDGIGTYDDKAMFDSLLDAIEHGEEGLDDEDVWANRVGTAELVTALYIHIAEHASSPGLHAAATELADLHHDYRVRALYGRRGRIRQAFIEEVATSIRRDLEGFAE